MDNVSPDLIWGPGLYYMDPGSEAGMTEVPVDLLKLQQSCIATGFRLN